MSLREEVLQEIDAFMEETKTPKTVLGKRAVNDLSFIDRIRRGEGIGIDRIDRLRNAMADIRAELAE